MIASSGTAPATAPTSASGLIGERLACAAASWRSASRRASCAIRSRSTRAPTSLACAGLRRRRSASTSSGSVAFGSPWIATCAG